MPRPALGLRDIAKLLLRDPRANDVYTNSRSLRRLSNARLIDVLLVSTVSRVEYLAEYGIDAIYAPLGYDLEHGYNLHQLRDIDVLFLGDLHVGRRRRLLNSLRRRGVPIKAVGDWKQPEFWGENRTALLNRAKIFLNIQRFSGEFSGLRMILGMANGALVLSEPMYRPEPFVAGYHFVSATVEQMPDVIHHYLTHDDELECIARRGEEFVKNQVRLERSVERLLTAVNERLSEARRD
jgi:hypothetical protein